MLWLSAQDKPQVSIHLYSPQITITNGSNSNLLIGYVSVNVARPTVVKSLKISFSGIYSAYWIDGTGQSRQEYYQNKRFHHDIHTLTRKNLQNSAYGDVRRAVSDRWGIGDDRFDIGSRSRSSSTSSSGCPSVYSMQESSGSSRHQRINYDPRHVVMGLEESADRRVREHELQRQQDEDDSMHLFSASSPALIQPPPVHNAPEYYDRRGYPDASEPTSSFELAPGSYRLEFFFALPPKMPSSIVSELGGIDYNLSVQLKAKNLQSKLPSACVRATLPVHVINLPSRFALLHADLPLSDGAVFTKQIENSWWALARLSNSTASPGDILKLSVCLSWPERCAYDRDPSDLVSIVAVKMDLYESTVCKSLKTGSVIKRIESTIASSVGHGATADTYDYDDRRTSSDMSHADVVHERGSAMNLCSLAYSASNSAKSSRSPSPVNGQRQTSSNPSPRGMFNESFKRMYELQVPSQKQTIGKLQAGSVHIDCRSAPLSVVHEVRILLQVLDLTTQKLHSIPFHTRLIVVPEAESFLLPAYSSSMLDTRVL
ncbi:hypothetical protein IWW45_004254 [Coemansia sp. RSA 485]|nr:hypothetical protein IWW45_004254 [Coemansia sp. RSA 485]